MSFMTPYQDNDFPYAPIMIAVRELERLTSECHKTLSVLDVGCSKGYLAAKLKRHGSYLVEGIEVDPDDAAEARSHCDLLHNIDLDSNDALLEATKPSSFDVILFLDVLEHLRDPLTTLKTLRTRLKPQGLAIVSLPNVAHITIRLSLLRGRFEYKRKGILDRTHLHLYTYRSARELLESAGYNVIKVGGGSNRFGALLTVLPVLSSWLAFNIMMFATPIGDQKTDSI